MMKSYWKMLPISMLLLSCTTAPYTGRSQLIMISAGDEARMGLEAYQEVLKTEKLSKDAKINAMVQRVGERIARAADRPDFQWEFKVIDSDQANAFCLPGGKVAVYTGLLPITQSEAGLAAVIGHEVAHVLARHGAERLSQNMVTQGLMLGANIALTQQNNKNQGAIMSALGIGAQVGVLLPFSRAHESEADKVGLILMAKAGYDPKAAVGVWQRMKLKGGAKPPEFLSTHPADDTRIQQIEKWLPEVSAYYRPH